jgi:hypothetical protein
VLFGRRLHPLDLNVLATAMLTASFAAGFFSGAWASAALAFAFLYGAGNGLVTITRGTLPLAFFDARAYGAIVGRLLMPSFLIASLAPMAFAWVMERYGPSGALALATAAAAIVFACAIILRLRFAPH